MPQRHTQRQGILSAALFLIFMGLALSPGILASFQLDPTLDAQAIRRIQWARIILILSGAILCVFRRHRSAHDLWNKIFGRYPNFVRAVSGLAILWIVMESLSYVGFLFFLSQESRNGVFHSLKLDSVVTNEPLFVPYLWSNYRPNPKSPKVNSFGWRWGGGPKHRKMRILCVGGSTTWGDSVEKAEESYPAQLEMYLQSKGYDVEVVNGGVSYFTSAEVLGLLASRGVNEAPDLLLIHTGENDVEPLLSPRKYQSDYSHWRSAEAFEMNHNDLFSILWRVPSWTVRLLATLKLRPNGEVRHSVARQLTQSDEAIFARSKVSERYPLGLKNNFTSILGVAKAHGIKPVTLLFRLKAEKAPQYRQNNGYSAEEIAMAMERHRSAMALDNRVMKEISDSFGVPVVPFDRFETSSESFWTDHCHLNASGEREKANFIGDWLVEKHLLAKAYLSDSNVSSIERISSGG